MSSNSGADRPGFKSRFHYSLPMSLTTENLSIPGSHSIKLELRKAFSGCQDGPGTWGLLIQ